MFYRLNGRTYRRPVTSSGHLTTAEMEARLAWIGESPKDDGVLRRIARRPATKRARSARARSSRP